MDIRQRITEALERIFNEMDESAGSSELEGGYVELVERALRSDGTVPIKLIQPGWGSSGYYGADVLERDGSKAFPAGTQMFWDHATFSEEMERPEGSLDNLAATLVTDAQYQEQGPYGPGLYADAKVFEGYQDAVVDMAPHIGVSIRASGMAVEGEADGQSGRIIQSIDEGRSVDFVTKPGAGGKIVEMFEAARNRVSEFDGRDQGNSQGEQGMPTEEQFNELREAMGAQGERVATLEESLVKSQTEAGRLRAALTLREAADVAQAVLAEGDLPAMAQQRIAYQVSANPPMLESGDLDREALTALVTEAATAEAAYLADVVEGGQIRGMGRSGQPEAPDAEASKAKLSEALVEMGYGGVA